MRLPLLIIALPLGASPIINSTSVQTMCQWTGDIPAQPNITLTGASQIGSSQVSCPAGYGTLLAFGASSVSGPDAIATAQIFGIGYGLANAHANAGFEFSAVALEDGYATVDFLTSWRLIQDGADADMSVAFYFNGAQIGGFSDDASQHDTFQQKRISHFAQPVQAGQEYTFGAQAAAEVSGKYFSLATVDVQAAPEPGTMFLVGGVSLGYCLLRANIDAVKTRIKSLSYSRAGPI